MSVPNRASRPRARALTSSGAGALLFALGAFNAPNAGAAESEVPPVQWNVGFALGACGVGRGELWDQTRFCGAVRSDALLLRARESSFGVGPYASVGTIAVDDARLGAGASLLVPVLEDFPIVVSLGGLGRFGEGDDAPGVEAWLFWGAQSFNFHSGYALRNGLLLGAQTTFEDEPEHVLWLTAELDAAWPVLPFVLLAGWLQGE